MGIYPAWMRKNLKTAPIRLNIGNYCMICARKSDLGIDLCAECEGLLMRMRHIDRHGRETRVCSGCGSLSNPPPRDVSRLSSADAQCTAERCSYYCAKCCASSRSLTRIVAAYRYDFPLSGMIQQMKYQEKRQTARVLGSLLARAVGQRTANNQLPDMLIPVPLNRKRQLQRGFNQARDIARWCARDLNNIPVNECVSRIVDTDSLAGLSRAERQFRILGAFRASPVVADKHVAIVDDVLTTGSTAGEMAREIYDTGASSVELWVLARTSRMRSEG
jgi:ComF family protein